MGSAGANLAEDGSKVPVQLGQVLMGKYRVDRILGFGGMGVVVRATHLQLDEPVAIKFLLPAAMDSPEAIARFAREARAAVKIKSDHVGRVLDVGSPDEGAPYIVMEYLEGSDLAQVLSARRPLDMEEAVEYLLHACDAIAYAHVLGIVHRDLKPANLFLTQRPDGAPCVKVLDFGISKIAGTGAASTDAAITRTSATVGSPLYMPPEQMTSSRDVDQRADIWSLGAILYELLSGRPPFGAATMPQICLQIMQGNPDPLREVCPSVPARLQDAVDRCLRKDPAERFQSVADLACALAPFAPPRAEAVVDNILRIVQSAPPSSKPASSSGGVDSRGLRNSAPWSRTKTPPRSRRAVWIGSAVAASAALAIGAFSVGRASHRADDRPTVTATASVVAAVESANSPSPGGSGPAVPIAPPPAPSIASRASQSVAATGSEAAPGRAKPVVKTPGLPTNGRRSHVSSANSADLLRDRK